MATNKKPISNLHSQIQKTIAMENLLYTIAVILVIAWAIGFLGYNVGGLIHILLIIALIAVVLRIIKGNGKIF